MAVKPSEVRALLRGVSERPVTRIGGAREGASDLVVVEEPLEIRVDGETVAITMRTPGDDERLALGFLLSEGLIRSADDVGQIAPCGRPGDEDYGNVLDVRSAAGTPIAVERVLESRRFSTTTASCGVCGRRSIDDLIGRAGTLPPGPLVDPELVSRVVESLRTAQPNFARTGGLHAAGAFDAAGKALATAEDVGRHNAVDKVVGSLLRSPGARAAILAVSGRTSFEIVQKAAAARIPIVAGVSAASSLAIDLATKVNATLAAFVRGGAMNVYAGGDRMLPGILAVDDEDGELRFLPLAARRALDAAGRKLSLQAWTTWPLPQRRALVELGAPETVDAARVRALCPDAPELAEPPSPGPRDPSIDEGRWAALTPLQKWAVGKLSGGKPEKLRRLLEELP